MGDANLVRILTKAFFAFKSEQIENSITIKINQTDTTSYDFVNSSAELLNANI